ncbi:uncharacterized protein [Aristolochia californica]|uniref:uncharacterized protein n=1 Tax=Aristolochia californica TaxID=171875 RepID=UPI0035E08690
MSVVLDVFPQRSRLRKSSSYPDLRQEEVKRSENGRLSWDDSEVSPNRRSKHRRHHRRRSYGGDFLGDRDVPTIFDDKLVLHQSRSIASPPSSSPQLPKPKSTHKFEALSRVAKSNQKKHKNRITSSSSISDKVTNAASYPPSPPPPPPISVFHNWFSQKKVLKTRKSLAVKTSAPPPPPQPPRNVAPGPEFSRSEHFDHLMAEDYLSSGGQSPLVPVAPPPPPFQMKDMRIKLKGDFVRVRSLLGDVSHSEAGDISGTEFAEERNVSMFCPVPGGSEAGEAEFS